MSQIKEIPREVFLSLRDCGYFVVRKEILADGVLSFAVELEQGTAFALSAEGVGVEECFYSPEPLEDKEIENFLDYPNSSSSFCRYCGEEIPESETSACPHCGYFDE